MNTGGTYPCVHEGGREMKKILKFGCGPTIAYNKNFICSGANKVGIIKRSTNEVCGFLTGIKNISSISMDDEYAYVKTTTGIYGMFDLESQSLECRGYCRDRQNDSHDGDFFCVDKGVVLDVLTFKDENWYAVKYNFYTKSYEKVFLLNNSFHCGSRFKEIDYAKRKLYFLFKEKCCLNKPQTNCHLSVVNVDNLTVESELDFSFEYGVFPIALINSHLVLLNNMEVADVYTGERFLLDSYNYYKASESGYFVCLGNSTDNNLILVFSKVILVYDMEKRQLIKKYECKYGFGAAQIDDKFYITTWEGLFLVED